MSETPPAPDGTDADSRKTVEQRQLNNASPSRAPTEHVPTERESGHATVAVSPQCQQPTHERQEDTKCHTDLNDKNRGASPMEYSEKVRMYNEHTPYQLDRDPHVSNMPYPHMSNMPHQAFIPPWGMQPWPMFPPPCGPPMQNTNYYEGMYAGPQHKDPRIEAGGATSYRFTSPPDTSPPPYGKLPYLRSGLPQQAGQQSGSNVEQMGQSLAGHGITAEHQQHLPADVPNDEIKTVMLQEEKPMQKPTSLTPDTEKENTVKITGYNHKTCDKIFMLYFENKKNGGGKILDFCRNDKKGSIVITFENWQVVQALLLKPHTICSHQLKLQPQNPPKFYEDIYIITNVHPDTKAPTLRFFLEAKTGLKVQKLEGLAAGTFFVVFHSGIAFERLKSVCQEEDLEDRFVRPEKVEVSTTIQVSPISEHRDEMEIYFSTLGNVEDIQVNGKYCLVRFDNEQDALTAVAISHDLGDGVERHAEIHHECLFDTAELAQVKCSEDVKRLEPPELLQIDLQECEMHDFLVHSNDFKERLSECHARLHTEDNLKAGTETPKAIKIVYVGNTTDNQSPPRADIWEKTVQEAVEKQLQLFQQTSIAFPQDIFTKCLEQLKLMQNENSNKQTNIDIRDDCNPPCVSITGLMERVAELETQIMQLKQSISDAKPENISGIPSAKWKLLEQLNLKARMDEKGIMNTTVAYENNTITFEGPEKDVLRAKTIYLEEITHITTKRLRVSGTKLLMYKHLTQQIDRVIDEQKYTSTWQITEPAFIDIFSVNDLDDTEAVIIKSLRECTHDVPRDSLWYLTSNDWQTHAKRLTSSNERPLLLQTGETCVTVTAPAQHFDSLLKEIQDIFECASLGEQVMNESRGKVQYLFQFCMEDIKAIEHRLKQYKVQVSLSENSPKITITGTSQGRQEVIGCLTDMLAKIVSQQQSFDKVGCRKYIASEKGCQHFTLAAKENKCTFTFDPNSASVDSTSYLGTTLTCIETDITQLDVDVIVNAANNILMHSSSLALDIVQKGGQTIQAESNKYVQSYGPVHTGDIATTGSGKLPCKMIVHAVAPVFQGEVQRELQLMQSCILKTMRAVDKNGHRSVAIPAVGTGVFNNPLKETVGTIVSSVKQFLNDNRNTPVDKIIFCDNRPQIVAAFRQALSLPDEIPKKLSEVHQSVYCGEENARKLSEVHQSVYSGEENAIQPEVTDFMKRKIKVKPEVKTGNIIEEKVQVIVNNITPSLDLKSGVIGHKILRNGGEKIQKELEEEYPRGISPGDLVTTTSGNMKFCEMLFHVCLPFYFKDPEGAEKVLKSLVRQCLEEATDQDFKSIAFPALGTGRTQYPDVVVAKCMFEAVAEFFETATQTTVSDVRFLLYWKDEKIISAFQNYNQAEPSLPVPQAAQHLPFTLSLVEGELANHTSDVIVNSANASLDLSKGAVAQSLLKKAGQDLQQECNKHQAGFKPGQVVATGGYSLNCKEIFHINLGKYQNQSSEKMLKEIVTTCLISAEKKHASVAFPMLGTGNLGYPGSVSMQTMLTAIAEFGKANPSTTLRRVDIVIYPKDIQLIKEVRKVYNNFVHVAPKPKGLSLQARSEQRKIKQKTNRKQAKELAVDQISFSVKKGNLESEKVDAIVHVTNRMDFNQGTLSLALKDAGKEKLVKECHQKREDLRKFGITNTTVSGMPFKNIIHIRRSNVEDDPTGAILQCLQEAESNGFCSLSFPVFGSVEPNRQAERMSSSLKEAFGRYTARPSTAQRTLTKVVIVCCNDQCCKKLKAEFDLADEPFLSRMIRHFTLGSKKNTTELQVLETIEVPIMLHIYAESIDSIKKCIEAFKDILQREVIEREIERSFIGQLSHSQVAEMSALALRKQIKLQCIRDSNTFRLEGLLADVLDVQGDIDGRLASLQREQFEEQKLDMQGSMVQWCYMEPKKDPANDDVEDSLQPYEEEVNREIEAAYLAKKPYKHLDTDKGIYVVDFNTMTEYKEDAKGDSVPIFRKNKAKESDFDKPVNWSEMGGNFDVVNLGQDTTEFKNIAKRFTESSPQVSIIKIERIQNKTLMQQYSAKRSELLAKYPGQVIEKKLYHGTSADAVNGINHNGFNRSYCGKNATKFGAGVYFALRSAYSARKFYSPPDSGTGNQHVYYAKVLTGMCTVGGEHLRDCPIKDEATKEKYDSVVDNMDENKRQMHVIFYDNQAYPDYLVTFKQ